MQRPPLPVSGRGWGRGQVPRWRRLPVEAGDGLIRLIEEPLDTSLDAVAGHGALPCAGSNCPLCHAALPDRATVVPADGKGDMLLLGQDATLAPYLPWAARKVGVHQV